MKLSLITATYNNKDTIRRCLDSLSSQSYKNIEHVIIDGKSSDDTLELIKQFGSGGEIIISEKDSGVYDALNKGIGMCTGELIGFLHADDYFSHPEVLSKVVQSVSSNKAEGVYGDMQYVNSRGEVVRYWQAGVYESSLLRKGWMPPHTTLFLKNTVYKEIGKFDTSFKISADYDLILRMLFRYKISITYLPEVLVIMQTGGISNKSLKNIILKSREDLRALSQNSLPFPFIVLLRKNLSKLPQLFRR